MDYTKMKQPDAKRHFQVSLAKSFMRLAAATCLMLTSDVFLLSAGFALAVAEVLGVIEELV
jgi:hypothetical protein